MRRPRPPRPAAVPAHLLGDGPRRHGRALRAIERQIGRRQPAAGDAAADCFRGHCRRYQFRLRRLPHPGGQPPVRQPDVRHPAEEADAQYGARRLQRGLQPVRHPHRRAGRQRPRHHRRAHLRPHPCGHRRARPDRRQARRDVLLRRRQSLHHETLRRRPVFRAAPRGQGGPVAPLRPHRLRQLHQGVRPQRVPARRHLPEPLQDQPQHARHLAAPGRRRQHRGRHPHPQAGQQQQHDQLPAALRKGHHHLPRKST